MNFIFRDFLILLYFKESEGNYILYDLIRLLSISPSLLEKRIDGLIDKGALFVDERINYRVSEYGLILIEQNNFSRINLASLIREINDEYPDEIVDSTLSLDDIYIPKNFENVLYSKREIDGLY
jgi:DNA-binding MarR family transcriptional regulator